jgi:DNA-binding response OmpR family regulator
MSPAHEPVGSGEETMQMRRTRATLEHARAGRRLGWPEREPTILLIEDDVEMRRMLAGALRRDGGRVVEAANGDEALDWLAPGVLEGNLEHVPDVIVSDIRLPYFSGLDILEGLQVAAHRVPVILITGFPDAETRARASALGAERVLEKPFDLSELRSAVRTALRADDAVSCAR